MSGISKNEQDLSAETEIALSQWQKLGIDFGVKPAEKMQETIAQIAAESAATTSRNRPSGA